MTNEKSQQVLLKDNHYNLQSACHADVVIMALHSMGETSFRSGSQPVNDDDDDDDEPDRS